MRNQKFILISILLFFITLNSFAQNFSVVVKDTVASGFVNEEIALGGNIINQSNGNVSMTIRRVVNDIPENWTTSLCFASCAPPHLDAISETIPAQDTIEFSIHFFTSSEPGIGRAVLIIEDQKRTSSSTYSFIANTNPTTIDIEEKPSLSFKLLGNYPNPFNSATIIRFEAADKINVLNFKVYSLLGKLVYEQEFENLSPGLNQIFYNGNDFEDNTLTSGIYVYQLSFSAKNGVKKTFTSRFVNLK